MSYKQLSNDERIEICTLKNTGYSLTYIAKYTKRHKSTISREIARNSSLSSSLSSSFGSSSSSTKYNYGFASKAAKARRTHANALRAKITIGSSFEAKILNGLKSDLSPEQISGRIRKEQVSTAGKSSFPSHVSIYNFIYSYHSKDSSNTSSNTSSKGSLDGSKQSPNNWLRYLKIIGKKGKYRRKFGTKSRAKERIDLNKKNISTRPEIVNTRSRLGDFEGDTIVGLEKTIHILTHVDRKSGYLIARVLKVATAEETTNQTLLSFKDVAKTKLKTITYDNGTQFSKHQHTEQKLNTQIYFANPYHSWERGTNENTNGLLRYYYPKKTSFKDITQKELDIVVKKINNRPRKRLNYLTPKEVFVTGLREVGVAVWDLM